MTTSLSFPYMFDVMRNKVGVLSGNASVVNRSRLLILTSPTELYNSPNFGVGLKGHLWKYNTKNEQAIVQDKIVEQLRLHEPSCVAEKTTFADGLLFTGSDETTLSQDFNSLKMTVGLRTIYGDNMEVSINE